MVKLFIVIRNGINSIATTSVVPTELVYCLLNAVDMNHIVNQWF